MEGALQWDDLASIKALKEVFAQRFADARGRGIDRLSASSINARLSEQLDIASRKALAGRYRFTPYLERLVTKGRGKLPRVLSVPAIRDRIVLHQLKEYLHSGLPRSVNRMLPNECIRHLVSSLGSLHEGSTTVIRADIESFYDTIPHRLLRTTTVSRISDTRVRRLLDSAICNPTVPPGAKRPRGGWTRARRGIPQGLAISNALANAYLEAFDDRIQGIATFYLRYVDDIVLVVETSKAKAAQDVLTVELAAHGLVANKDKSSDGPLARPFDMLGYRFRWPTISVRPSTVEKFLRAIAGMITDYRIKLEQGRHPRYITDKLRMMAFVDELNEKITGAISETRRYGWLFYFQELNDFALLHSMDRVISRMFKRLPDFGHEAPPQLKRLARAHFEARHSPDRGYIQNYNALRTVRERLEFLIARGQVDEAQTDVLTEHDVHTLFERYRRQRLQRLEMDVGVIS